MVDGTLGHHGPCAVNHVVADIENAVEIALAQNLKMVGYHAICLKISLDKHSPVIWRNVLRVSLFQYT